jgi:agmatine deiminase
MPRKIVRENLRLPASYANFYIANTNVLLPTFADPGDDEAMEVLQRAFPGRRIVPIDCRELIWGLGAFHCLTQQQPATE